MNRKATAAVLGAGSLWGIISIFVRQLNAMGLTALQLGGGRVLIGAVICFLWLGLAHRELLKTACGICGISLAPASSAWPSLTGATLRPLS